MALLTRPALAYAYEDAVHKVYGVSVYVHERKWPKFRAAELELVNAGVDLVHFANTVALQWKLWVSEHEDLSCLPISVFLGPAAKKWYLDYAECGIDVVNPDYETARVLHDEVMLCAAYMHALHEHGFADLDELASGLSLSDLWHKARDEGNRPIGAAAKVVCQVYRIECTSFDYNVLAERLDGRL